MLFIAKGKYVHYDRFKKSTLNLEKRGQVTHILTFQKSPLLIL